MSTTSTPSLPANLNPSLVELANHPDVIAVFHANYRSEVLANNPDARQFCEDMLSEAKRTTFYDTTPEQIFWLNEWSLENSITGWARFTFDYAVQRVGLLLVNRDFHPTLDPDTGEPMTDEEGKPVGEYTIPEHDLTINVEREGTKDCEGNVIPKGKCYFRVINQSTNRPRNESNYNGLVDRFDKYCLNGETLIKDANGVGISEQHRCIAKIKRCLQQTGPTSRKRPMDEVDEGPIVQFVDGIHPIAAITADTGKTNTGKDIFASDPELLPTNLLQTKQSLTGHTDTPEYLTDRTQERVKALGKCEGATKMVIARMGGKNVNANIGTGNVATELAHRVVSTILPDMDDLAAYCWVLQCPKMQQSGKKVKVQPVTPNDMIAAIALHAMRDCEPVDVLGNGNGIPLDEANPIRIPITDYLPLLAALTDCDKLESTPLTEWVNARLSKLSSVSSKTDRFAMVVRMVQAWFDDEEEVTAELTNKPAYTVPKSKGFLTFGGADRGPISKKAKANDDE